MAYGLRSYGISPYGIIREPAQTYTMAADVGTFTLTGNDVELTYTPPAEADAEYIVIARRRGRR